MRVVCFRRVSNQAMQWDDDDPVYKTPAKKTGKLTFKTPAAAELTFKTPADDEQHKRACERNKCAWCKSIRFLDKHRAAFQLVDDSKKATVQAQSLAQKDKFLLGMSWLGKAHRGKEVMLGCVACHALKEKRLTNPFASFAIPATRLFASAGKPHNLLRHAETAVHACAVSKFLNDDAAGAPWPKLKIIMESLGLRVAWQLSRCGWGSLWARAGGGGWVTTPETGSVAVWGAPPIDHFRAAWDKLSAGHHIRAGIDGVGNATRVQKLAWCLYETLREADAHFLLHTAHTIWLARDGRRQRLLIRFRAVGFKGGQLVSRVGVLGHRKQHGTDAAGIVDATKSIVQAALQKGRGLPAGLDARRALHDTRADASAVLNKVEALTVDAAADETLAGEMMRGRCCMEDERAMCPNLRLVVRDKTHASRRSFCEFRNLVEVWGGGGGTMMTTWPNGCPRHPPRRAPPHSVNDPGPLRSRRQRTRS